jgi:hypothetical protein
LSSTERPLAYGFAKMTVVTLGHGLPLWDGSRPPALPRFMAGVGRRAERPVRPPPRRGSGRPEHGEPGRDLPPEIMRQICGHLPSLAASPIRAAAGILIDTGRHPEEVVALPLDCLTADPDGSAVLVYDNHKANRLGRWLPIPGPPPGRSARSRASATCSPALAATTASPPACAITPPAQQTPANDQPMLMTSLPGPCRRT